MIIDIQSGLSAPSRRLAASYKQRALLLVFHVGFGSRLALKGQSSTWARNTNETPLDDTMQFNAT